MSGHTDTLTEASNLIDEIYKRREIQKEKRYRNARNKFHTQQLELPKEILKQLAINTITKTKEHMLTVMDKSTHEDNPSQPLQTKNKQFELAVTFSTGYDGIFNTASEKKEILFRKINY